VHRPGGAGRRALRHAYTRDPAPSAPLPMSRLLPRSKRRRGAASPPPPADRSPRSRPRRRGGPAGLGLRERGELRRRLRFLRRARELALRDLGGLVFDLYRFGRQRDALVREKLDTLVRMDREEREAAGRLGEDGAPRELREPGLGACARCGALHSSDARFCSRCGVDLVAAHQAEEAERHRGLDALPEPAAPETELATEAELPPATEEPLAPPTEEPPQ